MTRASASSVATILPASSSVAVDAQDDSVARVDYVCRPRAGRGYRLPTLRGGTPHRVGRTPSPRDGVHISVNHSLPEAARSGRASSVNVASSVGRGTPPAVVITTEIGERTRVRFARRVARRFERAEYWAHDPPLMEIAADPPAHPPTVIEMTIFMDSGRALRGSSDFRLDAFRPCPTSSRFPVLSPEQHRFADPLSRASGGQSRCASRDSPPAYRRAGGHPRTGPGALLTIRPSVVPIPRKTHRP